MSQKESKQEKPKEEKPKEEKPKEEKPEEVSMCICNNCQEPPYEFEGCHLYCYWHRWRSKY